MHAVAVDGAAVGVGAKGAGIEGLLQLLDEGGGGEGGEGGG